MHIHLGRHGFFGVAGSFGRNFVALPVQHIKAPACTKGQVNESRQEPLEILWPQRPEIVFGIHGLKFTDEPFGGQRRGNRNEKFKFRRPCRFGHVFERHAGRHLRIEKISDHCGRSRGC